MCCHADGLRRRVRQHCRWEPRVGPSAPSKHTRCHTRVSCFRLVPCTWAGGKYSPESPYDQIIHSKAVTVQCLGACGGTNTASHVTSTDDSRSGRSIFHLECLTLTLIDTQSVTRMFPLECLRQITLRSLIRAHRVLKRMFQFIHPVRLLW